MNWFSWLWTLGKMKLSNKQDRERELIRRRHRALFSKKHRRKRSKPRR